MHAPADRDPLYRHPELHSDDTASVAELLRSKDFELSLPRYRESSGCTRINAIDLSSLHLCYVSYGAEAVVTTTPARNDYRVQLPMIGRSITVMGGTETVCERTQAVVSSPVHDQTILLNDDCQRLLVYFASESLTRHLSAMLGKASSARSGSHRPWISRGVRDAACIAGSRLPSRNSTRAMHCFTIRWRWFSSSSYC